MVMTDALTPSSHNMSESNLQIDYYLNVDTKYHVPYKSCSVAIIYSKNDIKKVSPEYHIIYPVFPGTEPTDQSNINRFFGRIFGIPMEEQGSCSWFER